MPPRLQYFLVRPGITTQTDTETVVTLGALVPLIPVDQLPEWIEVIGVPRELSAEQTAGLSNLGIVAKGNGAFKLRMHWRTDEDDMDPTIAYNSGPRIRVPEDDGTDDTESMTSGGAVFYYQSPDPKPPQPAGRYGSVSSEMESGSAVRQQAGRNDNTANAQRQTEPLLQNIHPADRLMAAAAGLTQASSSSLSRVTASSIPPHIIPSQRLPGKYYIKNGHPRTATTSSSFCRHWCHHGTCKWGAACRYAHTMPSTLEGLADVGLKDFPPWWTTAVGMALGMGMGSTDQPGLVDMRMFSGDLAGGKKMAKARTEMTAGTASNLPNVVMHGMSAHGPKQVESRQSISDVSDETAAKSNMVIRGGNEPDIRATSQSLAKAQQPLTLSPGHRARDVGIRTYDEDGNSAHKAEKLVDI